MDFWVRQGEEVAFTSGGGACPGVDVAVAFAGQTAAAVSLAEVAQNVVGGGFSAVFREDRSFREGVGLTAR